MIKAWNWVKNTWKNTWSIVLRYHSHVCLSLILIIVFMIISLFNNQSWADSLLKSEKEKALIQMDLNAARILIKDQADFCDFQGEVLDHQRKALEKQSLTLEEQSAIISQLINYLKSIKHWPPKPLPPIDPDTLAGRSEAIFYDEEKISYIR